MLIVRVACLAMAMTACSGSAWAGCAAGDLPVRFRDAEMSIGLWDSGEQAKGLSLVAVLSAHLRSGPNAPDLSVDPSPDDLAPGARGSSTSARTARPTMWSTRYR